MEQQSLFGSDTEPASPRLAAARGCAAAGCREGPPLRVTVLGSGSSGNAVVVESGDCRLLLDAGFSCRELERRMARRGIEPETVSALVLTHEHGDHLRGTDRFHRRWGTPLYATAGTLEGAAGLGEAAQRAVRPIRSGEPWQVGSFELEAFLVPHDAREPVGLVIEDGAGRRLGLVGDLGSRSRLAWGRLAELDLLILETNHDLEMLRNGPYPWPLKQRVASRHGHLSNHDAAEGLLELLADRLRWVVAYHLSRTNNLPALAAAALGEVLAREGCAARVAVAAQDRPSDWLEVP